MSRSELRAAVAAGALAGAAAGAGVALLLLRDRGRSSSEVKAKASHVREPRGQEGATYAKILDRLRAARVVPVVSVADASGAASLATALVEGGLPVIEVVFRTAAAEEALRRMAEAFPGEEALLGAGTILSAAQAERAVKAGARFIVSPGLSTEVVEWCQDHGVPVIPGVATPTEVQQAIQLGLSLVKFFPAEANGGAAALKAISAPFPSLKFMPTGGVNESNLGSYLSIPQVVCCGGTWMVPQEAVSRGDWRRIKELSLAASALALGANSGAK